MPGSGAFTLTPENPFVLDVPRLSETLPGTSLVLAMNTNGDGDVLGETYLLKRGVLVETFLSHGGEIDSSPHCAKISERLNRNLDAVRLSKEWKAVKEILWIPVSNSQVGHAYWLARPLPAFNNLKFIAPVGSDSLPWIPQKTSDIAKDIESTIVITEAPIKAMALLQAGALPISLQGVWGSAEKKEAGPGQQSEGDDDGDDDTHRKESSDNGEKLKLHPELARFAWEWRQVLLCLDADRFKNKNVRQAEIRLAFLLHSAGAEVYQLSTWTLDEGKGVDDYLARRARTDPQKQREAFAELLRRATPFHQTLTRHDIDLAKKGAA